VNDGVGNCKPRTMPNKPWNAARGGQWLRLFTTQKQDTQTWCRAEIELSSSNVQRIVMAESYSSRTSPAEDVSRLLWLVH